MLTFNIKILKKYLIFEIRDRKNLLFFNFLTIKFLFFQINSIFTVISTWNHNKTNMRAILILAILILQLLLGWLLYKDQKKCCQTDEPTSIPKTLSGPILFQWAESEPVTGPGLSFLAGPACPTQAYPGVPGPAPVSQGARRVPGKFVRAMPGVPGRDPLGSVGWLPHALYPGGARRVLLLAGDSEGRAGHGKRDRESPSADPAFEGQRGHRAFSMATGRGSDSTVRNQPLSQASDVKWSAYGCGYINNRSCTRMAMSVRLSPVKSPRISSLGSRPPDCWRMPGSASKMGKW